MTDSILSAWRVKLAQAEQWAARDFPHWLIVEPRQVWFVLLAIAGILLLAAQIPWDLEYRFRLLGMIFQLAGIGAVALGVRSLRKLFNRPSYRERFFGWCKRMPRPFYRKHATGSTAALTGNASLAAVGRVRIGGSPNDSIDVRVAALEANFMSLDKEVVGIRREVSDHVLTLRAAGENERSAREQAIAKVDELLRQTAVGGLDIQVIGLTWLVLGVILASIPGELADVCRQTLPAWLLHVPAR